jgi:hypothetical protein
MSNTTAITDALIITTLLIKLRSLSGLGYAELLAQMFPALDAGVAESLANDAQIEQERIENAALPDDA